MLIDAAKVALKCEILGIDVPDLAAKKVRYAKWAIMLEPESAELWVHLHLCLTAP